MPRKRRGRIQRTAPAPRATLPTPSAKLEFRSRADDAWYSCWLQLEGVSLRMVYIGFPETDAECFSASQFETIPAIEEFRDRFRPESVPVEDEKCAEVVEGMVVCAFNKYREIELKFYDAIIDSVLRIHRGGKCLCKFNLLWQHGPLNKKKTMVGIDNICFIPSRGQQVDPILDSFLGLARSRVEAMNIEIEKFSKVEAMNIEIEKFSGSLRRGKESLGNEPMNFQSSVCRPEEMIAAAGVKHTFGKGHNYRTTHDMYLGSSVKRKTNPPECYFFFRVSNLETDITPICIMDFIFEKTSISSVAFVFPALSSESFSTGAIFVETKKEYEKLSEFLFNTGQLIMSPRGRPWVLNAKWNGSTEGRMPKYEPQLVRGKAAQLKLATSDGKEYVMGVELQKLHMKFLEYEEGLQDSLEAEMKKIARRFLPSVAT